MKNKRKKGLKRNPEVVILSRVKDLGPGKETSKLKPGFVKYLILRGECIYKKGNEAIIEQRMKKLNEQDAAKTAEAQKNFEKMKDLVITIKRESGTGGALYGSVSVSDIYNELKKLEINIEKGSVDMNTIKALGQYTANIRLYSGLKTKIAISVVAASF